MSCYLLIDPQENLDYPFDWGPFLDEMGSPSDSILTSDFSISPMNDGSPSEPVLSGKVTTVDISTILVSNCLVGKLYRLSNLIRTAQGRTAQRTIVLRCEER